MRRDARARRNGNGKLARRRALAQKRRRERQRHRGMPTWIWGPIGLLVLGVILIGAGAGAAYGVYRSYADDLVEPDAILVAERVLGTSKVFDRVGPDGGTVLFEFADPFSGLRDPVRFDEISQHMVNATVSTEDATFFDNRGFNLRGLLRAAVENVGLGEAEFLSGSGGSSITQQLVKNVLIAPEERGERSVDRKIKEVILAVELTSQYPKEQILEWYLNTIFYGNLAYGIGAASQRYFGKPPSELTLPESALLAGLPQAPAVFDPFTNLSLAKDRQGSVLNLMVTHGYISRAQAEAAKSEPLNFANQQFDIIAPHFVLHVRDEVEALCERGRIELRDEGQECGDLLTAGGLRITTTVDLDLQGKAEEILRADLASFEEQTGAHNAALVAIDPRTGEILAMVGSRDFFREDIDGQVNLVTALNSPGSSFKPITYIAGFVQDPEQWNPATLLWDVELDFLDSDGTTFSPENFDGVHRGPVTIRSALANSINIVAFRAADTIGVGQVLDVAHRMGITSLRDPSQYGPSLTLGGGEVALLDLAYAYSVFANNGVMHGKRTILDLPLGYRELDPISILEIRDSKGRLLFRQDGVEARQVIPAPQAYQITDILSDNQARSILYGLQSTLVLDRPAAAKTGTAGDPNRNDVRRDFWTVGYTPDLVTGVWVGNADNSPMTGGTSSRTAGLIWHDFMLAALERVEPTAFIVPDGLTTAQVHVPQLRNLKAEERQSAAAQDPCANTQIELFVAADGVPDKANGICPEVEIDGGTLLLATEETPADAIKEGRYLIPPIVEGQEEPDEEIIKWLRGNKVIYVRHESEGAAGVTVELNSPPDGALLQPGAIVVRGLVAGEDISGWSVAYAPGLEPADEEFIELIRGSGGITGQLTRWNTADLAPGPYRLRLVVEDDFLGEVITEITVIIGGKEGVIGPIDGGPIDGGPIDGEAEPQATEPEATEPEATEPEATEPEAPVDDGG